MRFILNFFAPLLLLGGILYLFRNAIIPENPCREPIPYVLGNVDAEFGVTPEFFLEAVKDAETVWEKPFGREFFVLAQEETQENFFAGFRKKALRVNLVYDYRQEATEKLKDIGVAVEENRSSYDALRARFETLRNEYENDTEAFERSLATFQQKKRDYEEEVRSWNRKGGAPSEEYARLESKRLDLEAEAAALEKKRQEVNAEAEEVNALVAAINRLARTLNLSVEKYNTVSTSRGETFEEGLYTQSGTRRQIDIYEFEDRAELVRLLAHELGHALGLGHVDDTEAIMYELNSGENLVLTKDDIALLQERCEGKY